jgi:hypothetical protein
MNINSSFLKFGFINEIGARFYKDLQNYLCNMITIHHRSFYFYCIVWVTFILQEAHVMESLRCMTKFDIK